MTRRTTQFSNVNIFLFFTLNSSLMLEQESFTLLYRTVITFLTKVDTKYTFSQDCYQNKNAIMISSLVLAIFFVGNFRFVKDWYC
ncbi:hypothetical protein DAPPUDRAFT_256453 [Daphnia pulex]|uniref:Uncharacterized protein n=1 Tax=Daphnia pulex TaxID=6669 RepID=E9HBE7_DAPPU|nr:hypothetical protein DAPPUDRAFT_256453 [Daphnia pulex]|eukprot:EFX70957.1 hypothetical protein DAPPUDRAFT_256453 [Daphnia pulex]